MLSVFSSHHSSFIFKCARTFKSMTRLVRKAGCGNWNSRPVLLGCWSKQHLSPPKESVTFKTGQHNRVTRRTWNIHRVPRQALHKDWRQWQKCPWLIIAKPATWRVYTNPHGYWGFFPLSQRKKDWYTSSVSDIQNDAFKVGAQWTLLTLLPSGWNCEEKQHVLRPLFKRCHGRFTTCPQATTQTHARFIRASTIWIHCVPNQCWWMRQDRRGGGGEELRTVCVWCAHSYTHLCYCLKNNRPTNTEAVRPFRGVCCGEMTAADACVLWFGESPGLVWLQTAPLAVDSSSIRTPLQWTAARERSLIEWSHATFQLGSQALIIRKIISLWAKIRHGILPWGLSWCCVMYISVHLYVWCIEMSQHFNESRQSQLHS